MPRMIRPRSRGPRVDTGQPRPRLVQHGRNPASPASLARQARNRAAFERNWQPRLNEFRRWIVDLKVMYDARQYPIGYSEMGALVQVLKHLYLEAEWLAKPRTERNVFASRLATILEAFLNILKLLDNDHYQYTEVEAERVLSVVKTTIQQLCDTDEMQARSRPPVARP